MCINVGYMGEKDFDITYFFEFTFLFVYINYIYYVMVKQFIDLRKDVILVYGLLYYTFKKMNWFIIY